LSDEDHTARNSPGIARAGSMNDETATAVLDHFRTIRGRLRGAPLFGQSALPSNLVERLRDLAYA